MSSDWISRGLKRVMRWRATSQWTAHFPPPADPGRAPGVTVLGLFRAPVGIAESARSTVRALRSQDYPVSIIDVGQNPITPLDASLDGVAEGNAFGTNLLKLNPDMVPSVYGRLGPSFFEGKRNIGYWAWEMVEFPAEWRDRFRLFDEIWACSSFVQTHLAEVSPVPVVRMRYAIEPGAVAEHTRADFGLPEGRFLFLYVCDLQSVPERKNPFGFVEAYRRAFGANAVDTSLVLKVRNVDWATEHAAHLGTTRDLCARLREAVHSVSGILIDTTMDRGAINALVRHCDCYVSLHRSEGFGQTLAEAMYFGKPCIATAWSGNLDFMTPWNSYLVEAPLVRLDRAFGAFRPGWTWADPDLDHAAALMRRVVEKRDESIARGARAALDMRRDHSIATAGAAMVRRLTF